MRQREKEKKRADALRLLEIWSEGENLLKKPTDFICKMKFFNTLPDVPADAKLSVISVPVQEFGRFGPTSLQRDFKFDMLLGPDLGLNIDMIDPEEYLLPKNPGPLAREDEELLLPEKELLAKVTGASKKKVPLSVPWLRRSEFITAVFDENLYNQSQNKVAIVQSSREKEQTQIYKRNLQSVIESFAEANSGALPVHPKNKQLKAVHVQSIVPSREFLSRTLHHVLVEEKPVVVSDEQSERDSAVYFPYWLDDGRFEALIRAVPSKRGRSEDDVDELFGEGEDGGADDKDLFVTTDVFAARPVLQGGMLGKFVFVADEKASALTYLALESRVELHELYQDYRGPAPHVPKRHRIATRPESDEDRRRGEDRWLARFGAIVFEEEDFEEEDANAAAIDNGGVVEMQE